MPSIKIDGYIFQFYSSDEHEPPHVHVKRGGSVAKIWLLPIEVQYNRGYNDPELNRVVKLTRANSAKLLGKWHEHFKQ